MARPRKEINEDEIDEIVDLYIKEILNGNEIEISGSGVTKFNELIANNIDYKRKNGELFNLYGYTIWAGKYKGEDYYGKKKIKEIKERNEVKVIGEGFNPVILDIIKLVDNLSKKPEVLKARLCKIFNRERTKISYLEKEIQKLKEDKVKLESKITLLDTSITNLMFLSQSYDNSLNDMFYMTKSSDGVCYDEFINIFNENNSRLNKLLNNNLIDNKNGKNIINMQIKAKSEKYKDL